MAKIVFTVMLTAVAVISTSAYRAYQRQLDAEADMWMSENRAVMWQICGYISKRLYVATGLCRDMTITAAVLSYMLGLQPIILIGIAAFTAGLGLYACSKVWNVEIDPYA